MRRLAPLAGSLLRRLPSGAYAAFGFACDLVVSLNASLDSEPEEDSPVQGPVQHNLVGFVSDVVVSLNELNECLDSEPDEGEAVAAAAAMAEELLLDEKTRKQKTAKKRSKNKRGKADTEVLDPILEELRSSMAARPAGAADAHGAGVCPSLSLSWGGGRIRGATPGECAFGLSCATGCASTVQRFRLAAW